MRSSGFTGLCVLVLACQAIAACDDSEDRTGDFPSGGSDGSSAGKGGKSSGGSGQSAGSSSKAGNGGNGGVAGKDTGDGGSDEGGMGGMSEAGMGGMSEAGMGGMGDMPECTTDANCDDNDLCTDDQCIEGTCQNTNNTAPCDDENECTSSDQCTNGTCRGTNNTAECDDLSACTTGQDRCAEGTCSGTLDTNACPACNVPSNIIQNCDFSMGLMHWAGSIAFQGGASTQRVVGGRNVIDITAGGEGIYSVQPRQEPLAIKQGMRYKLRIVAGASVERDIAMALTQAEAPYKVYSTGDHAGGGFTLQLEEQMKPFEFDFMMVDPDDANVKLEIKMGGTDGNPSVVYFDDVAVEEVKCTDNPSCDDGNECTDDVCDLVEGTCSWTPTTNVCTDDGDVCTIDECQGGQCVHTFSDVDCDCSTDAQCDDDNECTDDTCSDAGACENTDNTASCDDEDVCTVPDACSEGACTGTNVCFDCTVGGNLLTNCDLASGETGWLPGFFNGTTEAAGTQAVVDGRLVVNITNGGTDTWQVQPRQEGLVLVEDTTYVVKFNAMASVARTMELSFTQNGGGYVSYSTTHTFDLTTDMQLFEFEFTMTEPPPAELVKLEIKLGGTVPNATLPNTVTFDNMFIGPKP